jgi:hypothetical protein
VHPRPAGGVSSRRPVTSGLSVTRVRPLLAVLLATTLLCCAAGCGSSSSSSSAGSTTGSHVTLAKTKFALHAGLAFGAFHHFIYKPFKNHQLGLRHPIKDGEAALASAFVIHELKLAETDAKASPTLNRLLSPLFALQAKVASFTGLRHGSADASALDSANSDVSQLTSAANAAGQNVQDIQPSSPSG